MPFSCVVYGLGIETDRPLAGLEGLPVPEHVDVRVMLGTMPSEIASCPAIGYEEFYSPGVVAPGDEPYLRASRLMGGRFLRIVYRDGTTFLIDSTGSNVWATWPGESTVEDTATYLLGPILGVVLRLRGTTCMHASAIAVDGRAVAFVGNSGAGKSSTAAAFARLGYPVLSDDVLAVAERGDEFCVQPAFPRIRLWPESVAALFGSADALPHLTPTWRKQYLGLGQDGFRFQGKALPLSAVYFLGERSASPVAPLIGPKGLREALMAIVSDTYATNLQDPALRSKEFQLLGRLVRSVPLRQTTPSVDIAKLPLLCEAIIRDVAGLTIHQ